MADAPSSERRSLLVAGGAFFGILVLLVLVAIAFAGDAGDERTSGTTVPCAAGDDACVAARDAGERPGIIPTPGEGRAPDDPGEPGGAAQLALLAGLLTALAVVVTLVVRASRRARSRGDGAPPGDPS